MLFCVKLLVLLALFFTTLTSLVSVGTNHWIEHDNTHHQGLWLFCNDVDIGCQKFDEDPVIVITGMPDWHYAVLGCMVIGVILHVISCFCFLVVWFSDRCKCCNVTVVVCLTVAWIALSIAMGVYTQKFYSIMNSGYSWGYSFFLGWFSFVFNLFAVIVAVVYSLLDHGNTKY